MSHDAQVQVVAFQRHRDHLRDVARTEAEAQDALHGMHDAVALGQLGRRRMVTKEEVIEAVQAFKARGSTWKTESASALGGTGNVGGVAGWTSPVVGSGCAG